MKTLHYSIIIISLILIGGANSSMAHIAIPRISTPQSNFTDGDMIPIDGYALPNSTINIFLVNNYGNIQNSTQVMSNSTGYFNTSLGIPSHVIGGAWTLFAINDDGNFAMQLMVNFHGSNTPPFHSPGGFPPLKQFKLGIKPIYVQCRSDLHLIIKLEDGSPACVKPDTAQKLIERGWAQSIIKDISQINSVNNQTMSSSSNCLGKEISKNQNGSLVVLLMNPNSTATVCTTYQFDYNWNSYPNKDIYEKGVVHFGLNLGPKFNVTAIPSSLNITNASEGDTFSVLYKISSSPDSKGIYDSIPWGSCEQYPLAVGYAAPELKKSDFPLEMLLDRPCYNVIFHAASNKIISGMDYAEVIVNGQ